MICTATFSPDRKYRYRLARGWRDDRKPLVFIMLNPSTADETKDDPTIRRCIGYAMNQSFGGVIILNLFAWRTTDPRGLLSVKDPIGPENDDHLMVEAELGSTICCAWGTLRGPLIKRETAVLKRLENKTLFCLSQNIGSGCPSHPLYLDHRLKLKPFNGVLAE